jgi:hypothetical protein
MRHWQPQLFCESMQQNGIPAALLVVTEQININNSEHGENISHLLLSYQQYYHHKQQRQRSRFLNTKIIGIFYFTSCQGKSKGTFFLVNEKSRYFFLLKNKYPHFHPVKNKSRYFFLSRIKPQQFFSFDRVRTRSFSYHLEITGIFFQKVLLIAP